MMVMSIPYEQAGRIQQKSRTREALVSAARELVSGGATPTVEQAAAAASISRTTAYRYFSNQRALLIAAHPETGTQTLLPAEASDDPASRLDVVVDAFTRLIVETEPQQRTMLRLALDDDPDKRADLPLRQGRGIGWIAEALSPLSPQLPEAQVKRLVLAIRSSCGIEALVWLVDVAGLSREDAVDIMKWSTRAMVRSALEGEMP